MSSSVVPFSSCLRSFPASRCFSSESVLRIRQPKYWSFSFSINPSNEYSGWISFRSDWLDLLAVQGTLKSLLQHHSSKASVLWQFMIITVIFLFLNWTKERMTEILLLYLQELEQWTGKENVAKEVVCCVRGCLRKNWLNHKQWEEEPPKKEDRRQWEEMWGQAASHTSSWMTFTSNLHDLAGICGRLKWTRSFLTQCLYQGIL